MRWVDPAAGVSGDAGMTWEPCEGMAAWPGRRGLPLFVEGRQMRSRTWTHGPWITDHGLWSMSDEPRMMRLRGPLWPGRSEMPSRGEWCGEMGGG